MRSARERRAMPTVATVPSKHRLAARQFPAFSMYWALLGITSPGCFLFLLAYLLTPKRIPAAKAVTVAVTAGEKPIHAPINRAIAQCNNGPPDGTEPKRMWRTVDRRICRNPPSRSRQPGRYISIYTVDSSAAIESSAVHLASSTLLTVRRSTGPFATAVCGNTCATVHVWPPSPIANSHFSLLCTSIRSTAGDSELQSDRRSVWPGAPYPIRTEAGSCCTALPCPALLCFASTETESCLRCPHSPHTPPFLT